MPAKRFPISEEAIAAAARFILQGRRSYARAREPSHPSLRQVVAHLVGRGLVDPKRPPPPVTMGRALERAGVVVPTHWRRSPKKKLEVNIFRGDCSIGAKEKLVVARDSLCSSVDDGGSTRSGHRRGLSQSLAHPWRAVDPPHTEGAR